MKKQPSTLQQPTTVPAENTNPFGRVFLIKGETLHLEPHLPEGSDPVPRPFKSQEEFTKLVFANRAAIFGEQTLGLHSKAEDIHFLFDFSEAENPRCFILKMTSGMPKSMLSMIAMNAYLRDKEQRPLLIEALTALFKKDKRIQKVIATRLDGWTIERFLEHTMLRRLRALFLSSETDPETVALYSQFAENTWEYIDIIYLRKYQVGKSLMLSMHPTLDALGEKPKPAKEKIIYQEDFHLSKTADFIRAVYQKLKAEAVKIDKTVVFIPKGKHYIAMKKPGEKNAAFFHFRKTTIYLVVKVEEKIVRKMIKHHEIKSLPESVCKFWGAKSTGLVISSPEYLREIVEVIKKLIKQ